MLLEERDCLFTGRSHIMVTIRVARKVLTTESGIKVANFAEDLDIRKDLLLSGLKAGKRQQAG
jgi:hypothetical protein